MPKFKPNTSSAMKNRTPYKMKGYTYPGESPVKQAGTHGRGMRGMQGYGAWGNTSGNWSNAFSNEATFSPSKPFSTITSVKTPKAISLNLGEKVNIGMGISARSEDKQVNSKKLINTFNSPKTQISLLGNYKFGGGGGRRYGSNSGFRGSLSGNIGFSKDKTVSNKKKLAYGGKLKLGGGTKKSNIGGFVEHTSKGHISGGGTKFGVEGKLGILKGSAGYNIKTKKPEFKIGINI